jgi:phosphoserine phosphatase RsbU/P
VARRANPLIRGSLLSRRSRLERIYAASPADAQIKSLLHQVDAALERLDGDTYGLCEVCHEPIESDRLLADPLVCFCLDHLTPPQQRALENDMQVAARIQRGLLPQEDLEAPGWRTAYLYEGAGIVSGDYCDLFTNERGLHFFVGDVSGKGISAAMLMAHLNATCRALVPQTMPLDEVLERASRMFCESTLPTHFATLVYGRAKASGDVEFCIAGHPPALIVRGTRIETVEATGLPLGMFCDQKFAVQRTHLKSGETIVVYTDGLSETVDPDGAEYGIERLANLLRTCGPEPPREIIMACLADLEAFRAGSARTDDLTILVLRKL